MCDMIRCYVCATEMDWIDEYTTTISPPDDSESPITARFAVFKCPECGSFREQRLPEEEDD